MTGAELERTLKRYLADVQAVVLSGGRGAAATSSTQEVIALTPRAGGLTLLIAERVLGFPAEAIANLDRIGERNRRTCLPAPGDPNETDRVIRAVASGEVSEADFRDWIAARCG